MHIKNLQTGKDIAPNLEWRALVASVASEIHKIFCLHSAQNSLNINMIYVTQECRKKHRRTFMIRTIPNLTHKRNVECF